MGNERHIIPSLHPTIKVAPRSVLPYTKEFTEGVVF